MPTARDAPADDALADAERFGLTSETRAALEAGLNEGETGVWAQNVPAVAAFLAVQTQWRILAGPTGMAWLGLDYGGVASGLAGQGIAVTPELWADLRMIEAGVVARMNEGGR